MYLTSDEYLSSSSSVKRERKNLYFGTNKFRRRCQSSILVYLSVCRVVDGLNTSVVVYFTTFTPFSSLHIFWTYLGCLYRGNLLAYTLSIHGLGARSVLRTRGENILSTFAEPKTHLFAPQKVKSSSFVYIIFFAREQLTRNRSNSFTPIRSIKLKSVIDWLPSSS